MHPISEYMVTYWSAFFRRFLLTLLIVVLLGVALGAAAAYWMPPNPKSTKDQSAVVPPPIHVEWRRFDVSDHFLVAPPDGTTTPRPYIKLPPGSTLLVPKLVEGEGPETKKGKT